MRALTCCWIAAIFRAQVSVGTIFLIEQTALGWQAGVKGTGVVVIALDEGVRAAQQVITGIKRAVVAIIAVIDVATAFFLITRVDSACVGIVTRLLFIQDVDAAIFSVTEAIHSTWIIIDAFIGWIGAGTVAWIAQILGAVVSIGAILGRINAAFLRIACIGCTGVGVVACQYILTAFLRIACVGRTRILVITIVQLTDAFTGFSVAAVECACVSVITILCGVCASQVFVACLGCTQVIV